MEMKKRFEVEQPNKEDHKGIRQAADIVKQGAKIVGMGIALGPAIKKYGPKVVKLIIKK